MRVTFRRLIGPEEMVPAMRATTGSDMFDSKMPSLKTWHKMILSQHSSHRAVLYRFCCEDVPYYVHTHFVRHNQGVQFHVKSQRTEQDRANLPQGALINMLFDANVQALLNMSKARLCYKADDNAKSLMKKVKYALIFEGDEHDKVLGKLLMKPCQWYPGLCSEPKPCGRVVNVRSLFDIHKRALEEG